MCLFSNGQTLSYTSLTAITNLLCIQSIIRHELFTERDAPIHTHTHTHTHTHADKRARERQGDRNEKWARYGEREWMRESDRERTSNWPPLLPHALQTHTLTACWPIARICHTEQQCHLKVIFPFLPPSLPPSLTHSLTHSLPQHSLSLLSSGLHTTRCCAWQLAFVILSAQ